MSITAPESDTFPEAIPTPTLGDRFTYPETVAEADSRLASRTRWTKNRIDEILVRLEEIESSFESSLTSTNRLIDHLQSFAVYTVDGNVANDTNYRYDLIEVSTYAPGAGFFSMSNGWVKMPRAGKYHIAVTGMMTSTHHAWAVNLKSGPTVLARFIASSSDSDPSAMPLSLSAVLDVTDPENQLVGLAAGSDQLHIFYCSLFIHQIAE